MLNVMFGLSAHNMEESFLFLVTFVDGQSLPVFNVIQDMGLTCSMNMFKFNHFDLFSGGGGG